MKQPNSRTLGCCNRTAPPQSMVPKVKVEITGVDNPTRIVIQSAIVRALQDITPRSVTVKILTSANDRMSN